MPHAEGSDRRSFLKQAVAVSATLGGFGAGLSGRVARAIEPIQRQGGPFFKYSLAAYSFRDYLKRPSSNFTLHHFIDICAGLNLEGTELTSYYFPTDLTPAYLRELKQHCFLAGLDVSGTAVGNDFCLPPGEKRAAEIADVKRWIDHAEILGAPVIRIFSGKAAPGQDEKEAARLAIEAMEECCAYAGEHGVYLALENHGGLTAQPAGMLELVKAVKSPWFGVNVDSGNFHTEDPYADLAQIMPYAVNVQIKISMKPSNRPREEADFGRLAQMLREHDYRGYVVLEYEEREDPRTGVPKYVNAMREAFGKKA